MGHELLPWQQLVVDVGLEMELVDGMWLPAYREIVVTVPRQCGKTLLTLVWEMHRAVMWGGRQQIAYTAQTGMDARSKLLNDQVPELEDQSAPIREAIEHIHRASGAEAVVLTNGSRIFVLSSAVDAGHGRIIDLGIVDECFADTDDRREQGLLPAMSTRDSAQILFISTAGTERSVLLNRKVATGRASVVAGQTDTTAYFEWGASPDDDPADPRTWAAAVPALGYTISERTLRHAQATLSPGEFARAYLNVSTTSDERVIPAAVWDAVCSTAVKPSVEPSAHPVIGVDVNPERSMASIAVADESGVVELVEHKPGVGWLAARVIELALEHGADVVLDSAAPASSLLDEITAGVSRRSVTVHAWKTAEMHRACGRFTDACADGKIAIRKHDDLTDAVGAATRRSVGDSWLWGRKSATVDISPLIAATIAFAQATAPRVDELWFQIEDRAPGGLS